jgi:hypothetical protein
LRQGGQSPAPWPARAGLPQATGQCLFRCTGYSCCGWERLEQGQHGAAAGLLEDRQQFWEGEIECALQGVQGGRALPHQIGPEAGQITQPHQTCIGGGQGAEPADSHEAGQRPRVDPIGLGLGAL